LYVNFQRAFRIAAAEYSDNQQCMFAHSKHCLVTMEIFLNYVAYCSA